MDPTRLSHELRTRQDPDLRRRRWIVGLSLANAAIGGIVASYQMGMVKHLPDPPVGPFDTDRVDASSYGYKRLDTPDGLLMTATFAVTAILAGAGGADRARDNPALPIAMAGKTLYDSVTTIKLAREEWAENKALCAYCSLATVLTFAIAGLAMPEAFSAAQTFAGTSDADDGDGLEYEDTQGPVMRAG